MIITEFPRDLLMTGAIFGVAAFVWAAWGRERPPKHRLWPVVLTVMQVASAALAVAGLTLASIRWVDSPTAIPDGGPAFIAYVITFWVEVAVITVLLILAARRKRKDLFAPLVLAVVGIHFIPLAWVFGQPIYVVTGVVATAIAIAAGFAPDKVAARSFWCGFLGGGTMLVVGAICVFAVL